MQNLFMMWIRNLSFWPDCRGNVAIMFGLLLVPLVLTAGAGIDYAQSLNYKSTLQGAVDAAALAGASVYTSTSGTSTPTTVATNYMKNAVGKLPSGLSISYTVTPSVSTSGTSTTGYTVNVTATAQVPTSVMALASIKSIAVSVSATAENPVTTVNISTTGFSSSACDSNTIYWYTIPSTATVSTYVPSTSALNEVWTNSNQSAAPAPIPLTSSSEKIGFALKNVTGQLCGYGSNSYGGTQGSTHYFYSNLYPPSEKSYSSVTQNRSLQVVPLPNGGTLASTLASLPKSGFNSDFANSAPTCGGLNGQTMVYAWNDMGGSTDDLDYNDVAYTFSCSGKTGSGTSTSASTVILIK